MLNKQEAEDLLGNHVVFKEENTVVGCSPYNFKSGISYKSLLLISIGLLLIWAYKR